MGDDNNVIGLTNEVICRRMLIEIQVIFVVNKP